MTTLPMTDAVLYVEDDPSNIALLERMFRKRPNLRLLVASSARDGLDLARSANPRLILLDRRLPDMLGNEVLRQLKASELTAAIPVVVLSGDSDKHHADELKALGAADFLGKPFSIHELLALVDRFCG